MLSRLSTALVILSAALSSAHAACAATGKNVTLSGFIMDNFCITRGVMVDNPTTLTLQHPEVHSIHCLVDLTACTESGYSILSPPSAPGANYTVKYQLGTDGTALAIKYGMAARNYGKTGFNATLTGIDDGTPELKCISIAKDVMVDGKLVTLSATDLAKASSMPMTMPMTTTPTPTKASGTDAVHGRVVALLGATLGLLLI
ncbi:hypothetical protein SDRG_03715 [Saprolegnia diclina VS20]|uniref:MD-2-related lipid-recognition domain-containing protein n=1 Tax=Saprolegnia diclina (strain VS20) TaxID=1156394 RepID=T0QVP1_SAPDV|nr:hypothetical protein SDRG_03715 [Saprolegnia diclina VS20]EQC38751.1 hypothetical protein SDRG_03715 [Saprolegnia diclina VS20]|eukprot:XP_008607575.1 hypothetical protein SDRG_03715 [Saprolegnia diclina VS20]